MTLPKAEDNDSSEELCNDQQFRRRYRPAIVDVVKGGRMLKLRITDREIGLYIAIACVSVISTANLSVCVATYELVSCCIKGPFLVTQAQI